MIKPTLAVASLIVGCVAFGGLARLSVKQETSARSVSAAHRPAAASPSKPLPTPVRLAPLVIVSHLPLHRPKAAGRRLAPKRAAEGYPCSPWRAVGPVYASRIGDKPRQRHVRMLCFGRRPTTRITL